MEDTVAIDDETEKSAIAAEVREQSEQTIQDMLVKSGVAGLISCIPFGVGSTINEMLTQLALRRTHERMQTMFEEMNGRIRELGAEKIDREWFRGEEFQTLIFEALQQLHVTQDKQRIEMLGKALANSGATEFKDESRKELFLRLVRDLSSQHLAWLTRLVPQAKPGTEYPDWALWRHRPEVTATGTDLLILQMLAGNGLVEERLQSLAVREPSVSSLHSQGDIERALRSFVSDLKKPPLRYFCLSDLGKDFLKFVGPTATAEGQESTA
jgi:hypothetical protein